VSVEYDPLLAKLVVHAADRPAAIERALRALSEWVVLGVETNRPILEAALRSGEFRSGDYATDLVTHLPRPETAPLPDAAWIAAALSFGAEAAAPAGRVADPWSAADGWRF
jgi:acetyl/propionyl-CoA carboxylase alpha subunit